MGWVAVRHGLGIGLIDLPDVDATSSRIRKGCAASFLGNRAKDAPRVCARCAYASCRSEMLLVEGGGRWTIRLERAGRRAPARDAPSWRQRDQKVIPDE